MAARPEAGGITPKEAEVLAGLGEQLSNAEIAARMYISERTVETHVSSLLRKFGAGNRRELGRLAGRGGTTGPPPTIPPDAHDSLTPGTPSPVTRNRGAGNLPYPAAELVGRDEHVRRLADTVGAHRLVTVTGPGGVGKTSLAITAAHAVADRFADGVWLVELGEVQHEADVPAAVASALSLQPGLETDVVTSISVALRDQHALLLVDNCEHVVDGVVELVTALTSRCARLTVLATSREALGVGAESRFPLHPLDVGGEDGASPARELFCERAAGVLGGFSPSDAESEVVDEICRRLDGLPLAIELATARLSAMTVRELGSHLDESFELLAGRRGAARQQSLRATVAWSYDLLTDAEQAVFDRLSTFGADFDADAARAVVGATEAPVEDLLRSLVDKSLLSAIRGPLGTRFRQLETLRQYGEARLDASGDAAATMRDQLEHYVRWTESADAGLKGPDELRWHHGLTDEWPNVRNVFRWACDADEGDAACRLVGATLWWTTSRMRPEAEQWCHLALAVPSAADHPLRPVLFAGAALFAHMRGDGDGERHALGLARTESQRLGPPGEPWLQVAVANQWRGGPAAALDDVAELRRLGDAAADPIWLLSASLDEAFILATLIRGARPTPDEEARARRRIREVVEEAESFGQPSGIASAYASEAVAARASAPLEALAQLEHALELCAPLGVAATSNTVRRELASHYAQLGRPLEALALLHEMIPHHVRTGAWHEVREALPYVARALAGAGAPHVAAIVLGRVGVDGDELERTAHDLPALHDQLASTLGPDELRVRLADGAARPLADVTRLVVEAVG